jgi:hypothetical protein
MACGRSNPDRDCQPRRQQNGSVNRRTPSLFRAKRINHCNDFVARVALEVVDSSWWKRQLRVKSAGRGTTALSSNEGASRQPLFAFASAVCSEMTGQAGTIPKVSLPTNRGVTRRASFIVGAVAVGGFGLALCSSGHQEVLTRGSFVNCVASYPPCSSFP